MMPGWNCWCARATCRNAFIEQEQEADCDLIVIGKHGKDAIEELLLGRVTRHVLTESQGDILVSLNRRLPA